MDTIGGVAIVLEIDRHIDLAPGQTASDQVTGPGFQGLEDPALADLDIAEAIVDRFDLNGHPPVVLDRFPTTVTGHTVGHYSPQYLRICLTCQASFSIIYRT